MTTFGWMKLVSSHANQLKAIAGPDGPPGWELAKSFLAAAIGIMGTFLFVIEVFPGGHLCSRSQSKFVRGLVDEAFAPCSRSFHATGHTTTPFGIPFVLVGVLFAGSVALSVLAYLGAWGLAAAGGLVLALIGVGDFFGGRADRAGVSSSFAATRSVGVVAGVVTYLPAAWGMAFPAFAHVAWRNAQGGPSDQVLDSFTWIATLAIPMYLLAFLPLAWAAVYDDWERHRRLAGRGEFQEHLGQQVPLAYKAVFWTVALATSFCLWLGIANLALAIATSLGLVGSGGPLARFEDLPSSSLAMMAWFALVFLVLRSIATVSLTRMARQRKAGLEHGAEVTREFEDLIQLAMRKRSSRVRVVGGSSIATHTVCKGMFRLSYTIYLQQSVDQKNQDLRRSLVAHELGHCVLHYPRIRLARVLGVVAFLDPVLGAGLLDYATYEEEADSYAAALLSGQGGGAKMMIAALKDAERDALLGGAWIQAATPHLGYHLIGKDAKQEDLGTLKKAVRGMMLVFSSGLPFYQHPSVGRRIENLLDASSISTPGNAVRDS